MMERRGLPLEAMGIPGLLEHGMICAGVLTGNFGVSDESPVSAIPSVGVG